MKNINLKTIGRILRSAENLSAVELRFLSEIFRETACKIEVNEDIFNIAPELTTACEETEAA